MGSVTASGILEGLPASKVLGYDARGNLRRRMWVDEIEVTVVVDEAHNVIVTLWVG